MLFRIVFWIRFLFLTRVYIYIYIYIYIYLYIGIYRYIYTVKYMIQSQYYKRNTIYLFSYRMATIVHYHFQFHLLPSFPGKFHTLLFQWRKVFLQSVNLIVATIIFIYLH